ncbi:MAG: hypothetical protein OSJ73_05565 [Lachnospiraceae bacterium]|nr:hypothetical protein [Lachnospiraceae bacterium]
MSSIEKRYEQMYKFEENIHLYDFRFKDTKIPMWIYIRSSFIRDVVDRKVYYQINQIHSEKNSIQIKKSFINKYIIYNPFFSYRRDILFALWTYGGLKQHQDGQVFEDLIMPFLQMFPDRTNIIMDGNITNQYELDCMHPNWKMDDIFMDILYKRKNDISNEDKKNIKGFLTFVYKNCPLKIENSLKDEIRCKLEGFARYSKQMIKIFESYLQVVKPKVAIICCASYPDLLRTSMILACKNKKVITAELQHGLTAKYHSHYQYSDCIIKSNRCKKMLPDYFLTFGEYWNNQVKIPQKCNTIGYAKPVIKDNVPINNKILFCAGLNFDTYIQFFDKLLSELDENIEIYFRFHPTYSSKKYRDQFNKYLNYPNFFIADNEDLDFYMKKCRYVIVDGSTVCYEALFMGRIVFSFASDQSTRLGISSLPYIHLFNSVDDFIDLWKNRNTFKSEYHFEFFDLNYRQYYMNFLKKCGVSIK